MTRVLVTDGDQRAALAIVRSLGRSDYAPYVCASRPRSLAGASRFTRAEARVPDALADPDGYVSAVAELVRRWEIGAVVPVTEASMLALLPARDRLGAHLPFADYEAFRAVSDKKLVLETAARMGIAVPRQWIMDRPEDLDAIDAGTLPFPLVIKPSRSVGVLGDERVKLGVLHAADRSELEARVSALPRPAYPLLLQERIVGPGIGIFLLIWEDELLACFAHRRLREKPPAGGISVYSESINIDPELLERSRRLLAEYRWQGPAMVEYKRDAGTGTPYLMEVNGRFWGSLQLAIDAGVDFPVLLLDRAMGKPLRPVLEYRTGVRLRWWWGDVDHLLIRLRRSREVLALPPDAPGRWRTVREFARLSRKGDRGEVFRMEDPWPAVRETIDWLRRR